MIVVGSKVHWHTELELRGVVRSMSRWRRMATVEITDVPHDSTLYPGLVCLLYTESLREYVDAA